MPSEIEIIYQPASDEVRGELLGNVRCGKSVKAIRDLAELGFEAYVVASAGYWDQIILAQPAPDFDTFKALHELIGTEL